MKTRLGRALRVVGMVTGVACAGPPAPPAYAPARTPNSDEPSDIDREAMADPRIAQVLLRELGRDPVVSRARIAVRVDVGLVTLLGSVPDRLTKDRTVQVARVVRGVRAIIDRVEVIPRPLPDDEVASFVAGALSRDPVTADHRVAANAHEGVVVLSGDVDSTATRRIAENDALAIEGVRGVVDDLAVRPQPISDARLVREVERTVADDPWLDAAHLQVSARTGVVGLKGRVDSGAERARVEWDARTASPGGVDTSALRIAESTDDGTLRAAPGQPPSDGEIARALFDSWVIDPRVQPFLPTVEVREHIVVLTGVAPSPAIHLAAGEDARNVPGVADVRDHLKERPQVVVESDRTVLSEVASAFGQDPRLAALAISVEVRQSRVFLRGTVPTVTDRMQAIAVAMAVPGAADVDDRLEVVPTGVARK